MARPKTKTGQKVSYNLDAELVEKFKKYCEETERTQTIVIERLIRQCLEEYEAQKSNNE